VARSYGLAHFSLPQIPNPILQLARIITSINSAHILRLRSLGKAASPTLRGLLLTTGDDTFTASRGRSVSGLPTMHQTVTGLQRYPLIVK
jgi:hypothetical protein